MPTRNALKQQHQQLKRLMRNHQLTPEWEEQHGRMLLAPGITTHDSIRVAKTFKEIVLDHKSGRYIYLGMSGLSGRRETLRKVNDHIESLELQKAAELLRGLQQDLGRLIQEVTAIRKKVET